MLHRYTLRRPSSENFHQAVPALEHSAYGTQERHSPQEWFFESPGITTPMNPGVQSTC